MNVRVFQIPAGQEFRKGGIQKEFRGPRALHQFCSAQKWHLLHYKALVLVSEHSTSLILVSPHQDTAYCSGLSCCICALCSPILAGRAP